MQYSDNDDDSTFSQLENAQSKSTQLKMAVLDNNLRIAQILLEQGVNPNIQYDTPYGTTTILIDTIDNVQLDMFYLLIKYGANIEGSSHGSLIIDDIDYSNDDTFFPLIIAITMPPLYLNVIFTKILLESGANPNRIIEDKSLNISNPVLIEVINIYNNMFNDERFKSYSRKYLKIIIYLLEAGANPYLKNMDGKNAFDLLLNNKAKNVIDEFIKTKLAKYRLEIVQSLINEEGITLDMDTIRKTAESITYDAEYTRDEYLEKIQNEKIQEYVDGINMYGGK
tara:strand:+ start:405 stop:1250 length:846 start_codon:yes stop_codon:yes gene_type:complete